MVLATQQILMIPNIVGLGVIPEMQIWDSLMDLAKMMVNVGAKN